MRKEEKYVENNERKTESFSVFIMIDAYDIAVLIRHYIVENV